MQGTYNGWTNHATWEMYCYLTSEYDIYKALIDAIGSAGSGIDAAVRYCQDAANAAAWPIEHDGVNWQEVGEAFIEDIRG